MLNRLDKVAGGAFNRYDKVMGESTDPDVRLYNTLSKDDFVFISNKYGVDDTADYIETMEKLRLKRS